MCVRCVNVQWEGNDRVNGSTASALASMTLQADCLLDSIHCYSSHLSTHLMEGLEVDAAHLPSLAAIRRQVVQHRTRIQAWHSHTRQRERWD